MALEFVDHQTLEICLAAVKRDGYALKFVKEQTPEICMAAVKENGDALEDVKEQTQEICIAAVQNYPRAFQYVVEQTPEICLAAVSRNGDILRDVKCQTPEIIEAAINATPTAIRYVWHPTPEVVQSAIEKEPNAITRINWEGKELWHVASDYFTYKDMLACRLTDGSVVVQTKDIGLSRSIADALSAEQFATAESAGAILLDTNIAKEEFTTVYADILMDAYDIAVEELEQRPDKSDDFSQQVTGREERGDDGDDSLSEI